MKNALTGASTIWDHHTPGVVTDVERTRNGIKVTNETNMPTQIGDKIVMP